MIEVAKQYTVDDMLKEFNITENDIKYMRLFGKDAVDIIIVQLLCRGYEFLYFNCRDGVMEDCFIIITEPLEACFVVPDVTEWAEWDITKKTSNRKWCGEGEDCESPIYFKGKTKDGKIVLTYDRNYEDNSIYEFYDEDGWHPSEEENYVYEYFPEFLSNFETESAKELYDWFMESEW